MSDFNPVSMFFILYESLGVWLWLLLGIAAVLLAGIFLTMRKLLRAGASLKRPVLIALIVGAVVAMLATFIVPVWTLAGPGALSAGIDYLFAFLFALVPGAIAGAIAFILLPRCCSACRTAAS